MRLPRSPLLLAAMLALVPALALTVALGTMHRAAPVAAPRPTPTAGLPQLIVADRLDLAAPRALGPIDVSGVDEHGLVRITAYALAAPLPAMPATAPVWRLRGFADVPTDALQARLGVSPPTPEFPGDKFDGLIDPSQARVRAGRGAGIALLDTATAPTDAGSAIAAADRVLAELGLTPHSADASAQHTVDGWSVSFARRPVDGIPLAAGDVVAMLSFTSTGAVTSLTVDAPAVAGGAQYPLRSVQDAWNEVSGGRWFSACCDLSMPAGGPPLAFRADRVSLAEVELGAPQMLLVPMYVFTDSAQRLSLTVPALTAADLSEPGGFRFNG